MNPLVPLGILRGPLRVPPGSTVRCATFALVGVRPGESVVVPTPPSLAGLVLTGSVSADDSVDLAIRNPTEAERHLGAGDVVALTALRPWRD